MKPHRRIAAWMTSLVLALALTPVAQATPTTLNFDFAGLVGSTGAPGLDGWPGGQTISGRWTLRFDDDPSLNPPVHLPGDRWSSVPGGLSYTLQSVGAVPGIVGGGQGASQTSVALRAEAPGPFQITPNLIVSFLGLGVEIGLSSGVDTLAEALQRDPLSWQMTLYTDLYVAGANARNYRPIPVTLTQASLTQAQTVPEPATGVLVLLAALALLVVQRRPAAERQAVQQLRPGR